MPNKFYITTTLPYVNADPHIGFGAEIVKADVIARYQRLLGKEVFFNTGTDEHGQKIYQKAQEQGQDVQAYCDYYAGKFQELKDALDLSYNSFTRTTDKHHIEAAQAFWRACEANGDIYKKNYKIKYCVGCELEKTDSELVDGCCPHHPNQSVEFIEEENYFFRWSKYQDQILKLYNDNPSFVLPDARMKEIKAFVENGLQDFSISRLRSKMPWGVPVPGDDEQVMYVWFDALVNYISCLGWPSSAEATAGKPSTTNYPLEKGGQGGLESDENASNSKNGNKGINGIKGDFSFWPGIQVCGKDNLRQQSAMWQAMLMSAGIEPSRQILVFGFITAGGQKMSKSIGNVINPLELVNKYGTDVTRFALLSEIMTFEDSDFDFAKFDEHYNAYLANGLGNLVSRVSNLLEKNNIETELNSPLSRGVADLSAIVSTEEEGWGVLTAEAFSDQALLNDFQLQMDKYQLDEAIKVLWRKIGECNETLSAKAPWKMTDANEIKAVLEPIAQNILNIAYLLSPFMPTISEKIIKQFSEKQIKKGEGLFPRLV